MRVGPAASRLGEGLPGLLHPGLGLLRLRRTVPGLASGILGGGSGTGKGQVDATAPERLASIIAGRRSTLNRAIRN